MAEKKTNVILWIILIGSGLLIFWYGGTHGWFKSSFSVTNPPTTPTPDKIIEYASYTASISLTPNNICSGDTVIGIINTNIPNGVCSIFYNPGTGYIFFNNVNLDANGDYTISTPVNPVGTATFIAVCCDLSGNCKLSNTVTLIVRNCDNDGDGIPDNTDPDDDNDGWSDEQEIDAGTNPKDPNSHPGANCNTQCISIGYASGRGPFESGSSCVYPEVIEYLTGESGLICCCTPKSSGGEKTLIDYDDSLNEFPDDLRVKSTCVDSSGTHEDRCVDGMVEEWYVVEQMGYCSRTQYNCAGWFGSNSYCRSGYCFIDPYINPSKCSSVCSSFEWSYSIDNEEHCTEANINLCYYSGQLTGVHSYHAENDCCCFTCG